MSSFRRSILCIGSVIAILAVTLPCFLVELLVGRRKTPMKAAQAKLAGKTVDGKAISDKVRAKLQ